jgi:hypothetical protein
MNTVRIGGKEFTATALTVFEFLRLNELYAEVRQEQCSPETNIKAVREMSDLILASLKRADPNVAAADLAAMTFEELTAALGTIGALTGASITLPQPPRVN